MSNKSGTSNQIISLPQGGGALHGIGETFSPDLHTGTGNFTVPIALPPGRNGFQPELSLVYSTGNGNGVFGLGWGLSVPGVMRKTSKGIPRYDDEQDTFVLSGAEDLVPVERSPDVTRYRPRTEGLFARIEHHQESGNNFWKVWSKDGLISYYGSIEAPQANAEPAIIANPDPLRRDNIFAWKLVRTEDPFGNRIDYQYERDDIGVDGPPEWDQLYLTRIQYADFGNRQQPEFLVEVTFEYEDRPDPFSEYRSGFEIRMLRRCRSIQVHTHAEEERRVRTYEFVYLDQRSDLPDLAERLPLNGMSLLSQVRVVGHDDANLDPNQRQETLPALEFDYSRFEPLGRDFFPVEGRDLPARSLASPYLEIASLFGNCLPDILEMNGTVRYWRNLGNGRFDLPREMRTAPAGLTLADPGVQMIDANGDGRIDLLVTNERLSGYFPLRFGGLWDRKSFQKYDVAPSFPLEAPDVQLMDLDGNGVIDAIRSGSRLECFFNDPYKGWTETRQVTRGDLADFPNVNFSDPRVKWGDMTGDGLQDIVLVHDGNIEYWPNLGYGNWGRRVSMRNSPRYAYGYDPRRILIGDIDGDGLDDIVYVDFNKVILWINQSGNGWSDPIEIKGTPPVSDMDAVRLVDLLGTGISGVLWSADVRLLGRSHMYFLDFTGGVKPYLLTEMDNHMGSLTRVGYKPSIQFYLEDEARPETRWKTNLPFPVQVVSRVEVIDQISQGKLTTEYKYHHGHWDGGEREFRGFGRVEQCDTEVFEDYNSVGLHGESTTFLSVDGDQAEYFSPPTLTKTWFHQGPVGDEFGEWEEVDYSDEYWQDDPQVLDRPQSITDFLSGLPRRVKRDALRTLRGQVLRTELYALDEAGPQERPYTVTESVNGVREESPPDSENTENTERLHIFFPFSIAQRTTQWERGEEPMTQVSFTADYDDYGQPRMQASIAVPRGRNYREAATSAEPYLATQSVMTYAQRDDADRYIVDRTATSESFEIINDGTSTLFELWEAIQAGTATRDRIGQSLNYYDGQAFEGLPLRELGEFGALVRTETLVLTEAILQEVYRSSGSILTPPEMPPYLEPDGTPDWTEEYPEAFRSTVPSLAGYDFQPGDADHARGYFVTTARQQYDFQVPNEQVRGLLRVTRDPMGHDTTIDYDEPFNLLPLQVTDAIELTTTAEYDYRVMQPKLVTDPNGNRQQFGFTPLGLLAWIAILGKENQQVGDTEEVPGTRLFYNFLAVENSSPDDPEPISVRTVQREHHVNDLDVPPEERDNTLETVEYSDGFGRLVQTRTQAEEVVFGELPFGGDVGLPADQTAAVGSAVGQEIISATEPRVVVSGWQVYDNKGRVVEKYEPFYSQGWDYQPPREEDMGQKATMFYDPRGQVIRTVNPDGSEQRVIYGVPTDLADPEQFTPTPWEAYTYDANDNAGRTHGAEAASYQSHWNTPASVVVDALGRTVEAVERNGPSSADQFITRSTYDIRGNLLTVTDALGRMAFRYSYDLANNPLRTDSIDAGVRRTVLNAVGNVIEGRDSKGALILSAYDDLNRPTRLWARDDGNSDVTLRQVMEYGDGGEPTQSETNRAAARELNRLGQLVRHYDEAGRLDFEEFDFKGNLLLKTRRVIADASLQAVFDAAANNNWQIDAFRVEWPTTESPIPDNLVEALLNPTEYVTSMTYDALNRMKAMQYPEDVEGNRQELLPRYNRAGALEQVTLDGQMFVERIAYNAKGQRILVAYGNGEDGNGVMTRYAYDPETFRLLRLRTDRYTHSDLTYQPSGSPLQDFVYTYDLTGNILTLVDRTPRSGVSGNIEALRFQGSEPELAQALLTGDALFRQFEYDPLYRLRSATGRECRDIPRPRPMTDDLRCGFNQGSHGTPTQNNAPDLTALYRETYDYDPAGNMLNLRHQQAVSSNGGTSWDTTWSRNFGMGLAPEDWNQEWATRQQDWVGQQQTWDNPLSNRLTHVEQRLASGGNNPPVVPQTHFFDANGNLVRENEARHFEWDHSDRMKAFRTQTAGAEPSIHAHYVYDAGGQRVMKWVRRQGGQIDVTVYVDGVFEQHRRITPSGVQENNTLHVMDDQSRIALVRVGEPFDDEEDLPAVKFYLGDHLGSSNVVISDTGDWVNREEFTPYGETSFGSFARKRYRYTGKDRDEENGLNYYGARFYSTWICHWIIPDPLGAVDGMNLYRYVRSNPINFLDPMGYTSTSSNQNIKGEAVVEAGFNQSLDDAGIPYSTEIRLKIEVNGTKYEAVLDRAYVDPESGEITATELKGNDPKARSSKGQKLFIEGVYKKDGIEVTFIEENSRHKGKNPNARNLGLEGKKMTISKKNFKLIWKGNLKAFQSHIAGQSSIVMRYFNRTKWILFRSRESADKFISSKRNSPKDFSPPRRRSTGKNTLSIVAALGIGLAASEVRAEGSVDLGNDPEASAKLLVLSADELTDYLKYADPLYYLYDGPKEAYNHQRRYDRSHSYGFEPRRVENEYDRGLEWNPLYYLFKILTGDYYN